MLKVKSNINSAKVSVNKKKPNNIGNKSALRKSNLKIKFHRSLEAYSDCV